MAVVTNYLTIKVESLYSSRPNSLFSCSTTWFWSYHWANIIVSGVLFLWCTQSESIHIPLLFWGFPPFIDLRTLFCLQSSKVYLSLLHNRSCDAHAAFSFLRLAVIQFSISTFAGCHLYRTVMKMNQFNCIFFCLFTLCNIVKSTKAIGQRRGTI